MCTEPCGSATGATLSTEGRDRVWVQRNSAHYQLAHGGQEPGAASLATMGVNTWRRGWSKLLAFPSREQEPASAGFHASDCEDTRTSKPMTAPPLTPTSPPHPAKRAQRTGCNGGLGWHAHPVAGGITEPHLPAKQLLGRKCSCFFPRRSPSRPVHLTAQLKTVLGNLCNNWAKDPTPKQGGDNHKEELLPQVRLQAPVTMTLATPASKGIRASAP